MLNKFALLTLLACCYATPPPGYVKPPEVDKYPPKYEYGYTIQDNKGYGQGKLESREGIFSLGRYFVELGGPKSASQNVQYITDEWGYHPLVEYSSMGDHSQTSTQFALGEKAVEALRNNVRNQISVNGQAKLQPRMPSPSPTQTTNFQFEKSTPPSPSPGTIIQTSPVPTTQTTVPTVHQPFQQNVPVLQNSIPVQYLFQPFNLQPAKYLIQPQAEHLPQPQFYIQEPNIQHIPQTQFLIPLYDPGLDNSPQVHRVNINLQPTPQDIVNNVQIRKEQNKNNNLESQNVLSNTRTEEAEQDNYNLKIQKNIAVLNKLEDEKVSFAGQDNQSQKINTVIDIPKQQVEPIQLNSGIINQQNQKYQTEHHSFNYQVENLNNNNNGQYLIEIKNNEQPQQNIVFLPRPQEDKIVIENSGQVAESSTLKFNEKLNHEQEQEEIEYISQALQNDLNLQNTEPLFGNSASKVRYTSNRNSVSNRIKESQNLYDESILNLENPGGYGSRIKVKVPNYDNSVQNNHDISTKLIDRTRNLVTGVDVLNINDAITNYVATAHAETQTEQNKNIINEYSSKNVQYGYNENVPNTILEAVSNYNNKNILNTAQEQQVITESTDYNNQNIIQESNIESKYKTKNEELTSVTNSQQQNNLITSSSTYASKANAIQNTRNKILEILNSEKVKIEEEKQNEHISFSDQPIVVADLENYQESVQSTTEHYKEEKSIAETIYSTTQNTVETKITENNIGGTESPILITPRPVSNSFLAPITAAVSLQNSANDIEDFNEDNYAPETSVEVQKSVPYYLGRVEFVESQENLNSQQSSEEQLLSTKLTIHKENSESEATEEEVSQEQEASNNYPRAEALILTRGQNSLNLPDQFLEQDEIKLENSSTLELKQMLDVEPTMSEAQESKIVNKPVELTKIIEKPYPVEIPIGIPYTVEKKVPIEVERIVEKPVHITKIVEKHVPVHIPQLYPVEVEKIVEKEVKVPEYVTKYINNPYPVHIPYPEPIAVPVEVERLVQTVVKEPYPVEVPYRVEVPVKVPVNVPVHVTKYIDKPYPVEKIVERRIPVEKIIEKAVTKYIDKPYPVHVHVPVPHPVAVPVEIKVPQPYPVEITKYIEKPYGLAQAYSAPIPKTVQPLVHHLQPQQQIKYPVTKLMQIPVEVPKYFDRQIPLYVKFQQQHNQNPYLYAPKYQIDWKNVANCELNHQNIQNQNHGQHRFAKIPDYIGLVPPVAPTNLNFKNLNSNYKRKARNSFEQNLRIEYGFKPPIIPSVQTDEFGMPLNEEE